MAFKMKGNPMQRNYGSALKHKGTHPGPDGHKEHKTTTGDKMKSQWYSEMGDNKGNHAYNDKKQQFRNYRASLETWEKADPEKRGDKPKSPSWMSGF